MGIRVNAAAIAPAVNTSRTVVVTGVATGIGYATAQRLTSEGVTVFGSVRRAEDAERLQRELGSHFTPLLFDVTDQAAIARAVDVVSTHLQGRTLMGLVNNSGIGIGGPLALQPIEEIRQIFDVNILGLFAVTQAFLPLLGMDPAMQGAPGRIINMSSVGGKLGGPFLGAYVGTKHALEGMSESLRRELMGCGIDVILIGPGAIATPIWDKAEAAGDARYASSIFAEPLRRFAKNAVERGRAGLPAARVADLIWTALSTASPKVRYAIVPQPFMNWIVPRLLPRRMIDRLIAKKLGIGSAR